MQQNLYMQQQKVEQASNLFHSDYLEHLRVINLINYILNTK